MLTPAHQWFHLDTLISTRVSLPLIWSPLAFRLLYHKESAYPVLPWSWAIFHSKIWWHARSCPGCFVIQVACCPISSAFINVATSLRCSNEPLIEKVWRKEITRHLSAVSLKYDWFLAIPLLPRGRSFKKKNHIWEILSRSSIKWNLLSQKRTLVKSEPRKTSKCRSKVRKPITSRNWELTGRHQDFC